MNKPGSMQVGLVKRDIQDADYIGYLPFKGNAELRSKCVLEIAPEFYTLTNPVSAPLRSNSQVFRLPQPTTVFNNSKNNSRNQSSMSSLY